MNDDYEDLVDEYTDEQDQAQDISDEQLEQYEYGTVPTQKENENLYKWFWKVVELGHLQKVNPQALKQAKVGNLLNTEVGESNISTRDSLNLALLGNLFNHKMFGDYFAARSMITTATSMSRKGWFMDLSISQKKVRERSKSGESQTSKKSGWRIFGGRGQQQQGAPQ